MNELSSLLTDIRFLRTELPVLVPGVTILASADVLLKQISGILSIMRTYAEHGEELVRSLFRIVAVFHFASLQWILLGCSFGFVATIRKKSALMTTAVWCIALSLVINSIAIGASFLTFKVIERTADALDEFQSNTLTTSDLQRATGASAGGPLVSMFAVCLADGSLDLSFLEQALDSMAASWNGKAESSNATNTPGLTLPRSATVGSGLPANPSTMILYSDYHSD
jgi:hypothetical protein